LISNVFLEGDFRLFRPDYDAKLFIGIKAIKKNIMGKNKPNPNIICAENRKKARDGGARAVRWNTGWL